MESIFIYFQNQEVEFDEKSEAGKCERNSSDNKNKKKTLPACSFSKAEITKESNSEKSKEKNPGITTGLLETTNDAEKSKNGTGEDGMDLVIEKHGEALEEDKEIKKTDGPESVQDGSESKAISDDKEGINTVETSKNTNEESQSSKQEYEDDLDEIHKNALKPGQQKSDEFKEVKNKESDNEQSGYSPGQDKKASKHKSLQAESGSKPAKGSYDKKRPNKKEKRWLKKKVIKLKKASEKSKSNEQKSENAIDEDVMKHESGISDECKGVDSKSAGHEQSGHDEKNEYKENERGNDVIASGSSKTENASEKDDEMSNDETKGTNTVEISTEANKETKPSDQKFQCDFDKDASKTEPETLDEVKDASNSEAGKNKPDSSPGRDEKKEYKEGEDALKIIEEMKDNVVIASGSLKTEDVSKPDKVSNETKGPNAVEMSTELNKETTSSEKQTEGDTFKTGPGTPDEINDQSNSGACDNHPENSPELDGKSMEGKEEILDSEDLSKKKAVDAGPNTVEMSTELNKETTSIDKKTEGDTFKTGPGTPDEVNVASNSGAYDNHPENSPEQDGKSMEGKEEILDCEQDGKSMEGKEEILDCEDLSKKKAVDAKCISSGAGCATEDQPAVPALSNSNSGANTIESEDGEPSDEVVSSKKEEADNSSENVDPSKIDGSSANVEHLKKFEADMVENPGASGKNKLPQTGNLEQANFVKTSNGEDENGKNADKSTVLGETKNDGDDGTPASGAGTIGENLGSDIFDNMQETVI